MFGNLRKWSFCCNKIWAANTYKIHSGFSIRSCVSIRWFSSNEETGIIDALNSDLKIWDSVFSVDLVCKEELNLIEKWVVKTPLLPNNEWMNIFQLCFSVTQIILQRLSIRLICLTLLWLVPSHLFFEWTLELLLCFFVN